VKQKAYVGRVLLAMGTWDYKQVKTLFKLTQGQRRLLKDCPTQVDWYSL
jgi:hypothetical protein